MGFDDIVKELRAGQGLSYRRFAAGVNQYLPPDEQYTGMTALNWERGRSALSTSQLFWLDCHAPDGTWQRDLARRALATTSV